MDISYRRRQPTSRLERLLGRLVLGQPGPLPANPRVDLIPCAAIELRQA